MTKTRYVVRPEPRLQKLQRDIRKQFGTYKSTYLAKVDGAIRLPGGLFWVHDATGTDANGNTTYGAPRKMLMLPGAAIFPRPNTKVDVVTIHGIDYIARTNSHELERMGVDPHQSNMLDPGVQYKALDWIINLQAFKTPGASSTHIIGSIYKKPNGEYDVLPTTGGYDFVTANIPSTDTQVVICQWLDTDANTVSATVSSEVSRDLDLKHADNLATTLTLINECVSAAPANHVGINAWRVYDDSTIGTLDDKNKLADLRGIIGTGVSISSALPAFGVGVIKTLASDVASAGTDRHLIIAAQSGTADDLIEITGLNAGEECIIRADSGDTITVKHNAGGATDKILLHNSADLAISGDKTLKLNKIASGKVVQYVDEGGGGGGNVSTGNAVGIPRLEFDPDAEPASPDADDDEFTGTSLDGDWSWVNQGSATATVAKSRLLLSVPSTSSINIRGIFRTYPGQSTWIAQITGWSSLPSWSGSNNYSIGIARRDSASSRIETYGLGWDSTGTALLMRADKWTNTTTYSAAIGTNVQLGRVTFGTVYLKLVDDNTNVAVSWSLDGVNYTQWASFARAAFLASADQIGLAVFTQQNGGDIYLQSDWMRQTA